MIKSSTPMPTGLPDMRGDCLVGRAMVKHSLEGRRRRQGKGGETHPFLVKPRAEMGRLKIGGDVKREGWW